MIAIDVADLVVIAGDLYGIDPGAALDRLDIDAAQAALAEADLTEGSLAPTAPDLAEAATRLIQALIRHQPFPAHGQQLAVLAGLQFLAVNGWQADLDPPGAALVLVEGLASGRLSPADAAAWLSPRLSPHSASPAREAPMRTRLPGRRLFRAVDPRPRAGVRTPVTGFIPFTDDAREVAVRANEQAIRLGLDHAGSEQFLLALAGTGQGVAALALKRLGIRPDTVRERVTQLAQVTGQDEPRVPPGPDTPLAMRLMPRALGEAVAHGHDYIGTEHLLLALFCAGDDAAARTLASLGVGESEVRGAVTALLAEAGRIGPGPHRIRNPVSRDDEIRRLRREVARLADLLREHGIEPGTGDRKSA
jgi:prophage maintenance system killer protein